MDEAFWAWVDETYPNLANATAKALALDAWRAATERAESIAGKCAADLSQRSRLTGDLTDEHAAAVALHIAVTIRGEG